MRELVVLSGKGGTGKTSVAGSLAALAEGKVMVDCDVDAADLHLLLKPETSEEHDFISGQTAVIDPDKCRHGFLCQDKCRFSAISNSTVDATACEGCGFCALVCPEGAITMQDTLAGRWFVSGTRYGPLVHARLGTAQENCGKLVAAVRQRARQLAEEAGLDLIISDGPPGIGCPVISSLSGADLALLVTEPTLSGQHDLERVLELCGHFGVPATVCINKYDINEDNTRRIEAYCRERGVSLAARIPFDGAVTEAMARGVPLVAYTRQGAGRQMEKIWAAVAEMLAGTGVR